MRLYMDCRKAKENKYLFAYVVFEGSDVVLQETEKVFVDSPQRFDLIIKLLQWVLVRCKYNMQMKDFKVDKLDIYFDNKVFYSWLSQEKAPQKYSSAFNELLIDFDFFLPTVEAFLTDVNYASKFLSEDFIKSEGTKAIDFFSTVEEAE
jgi:hypothetical protein